MKKKILFVLINRANYGRAKTVLEAVKNHPNLDLTIVAGSGLLLERFGKAVNVIREDDFIVNEELYMNIEGEIPQTMAQSVGLGLIQLAPIFARTKPDVVVTIADRYEILATAIAATYMNLPLAHIQGGELTGTIDESVRHAVTKLSHYHFTSTEGSRERVIQMGENPDYVFNTGCPSIDLVKNSDISKTRLQSVKIGGLGKIDLSKPYILVMQHPVTTEFGNGFQQMNETLEAVKTINMPTLLLWPNPDAGSDDMSKAIRLFREKNKDFPIQYFKNLEPEDYYTVLANSSCLIGNSSSFVREGSFLGTPVVMVGSRQNNREHSNNLSSVDYNKDQIAKTAINQIKHGKYKSDNLYGKGDAGTQIADLLATKNPPIQKVFHSIEKTSPEKALNEHIS